jgi:4-hydroxybenzoate polyprenyltransferase
VLQADDSLLASHRANRLTDYNSAMNDSPPPSALLSWLRLLRAPNVFTAIADIVAGFGLVAGWQGIKQHPLSLALLVLASSFLYLAGMVLNDVADIDVDTKERPFRPLPSGAISLATARNLGWGLLVAGVIVGGATGWVHGQSLSIPIRPLIVSVMLATAIVLYNFAAKRTPLGSLVMGSCRTLNWLLGMSVAANIDRTVKSIDLPFGTIPAELLTYPLDCWLAAIGIGVYVAGITIFAKGEAQTSRRGPLILGLLVMAAGIALIASLSLVRVLPKQLATMYPLLLAVIGGPVMIRGIRSITDPQPAVVQMTVKSALMSLIVLDAAACLAGGDPKVALAVALLLLPMLGLGRWVYST